MGRRIVVEWTESADELYRQFTAERNVLRRQRLQALWLVRTGASIAEASRVAGVGQRSLERWLGWYRIGGLPEVLARVPGHGARGAPSRLSPEHQAQLLSKVREGAFRTYAEARAWVAERFGVNYSYQGIYSVLARLEFQPKTQPAKADPAAHPGWERGISRRRS